MFLHGEHYNLVVTAGCPQLSQGAHRGRPRPYDDLFSLCHHIPPNLLFQGEPGYLIVPLPGRRCRRPVDHVGHLTVGDVSPAQPADEIEEPGSRLGKVARESLQLHEVVAAIPRIAHAAVDHAHGLLSVEGLDEPFPGARPEHAYLDEAYLYTLFPLPVHHHPCRSGGAAHRDDDYVSILSPVLLYLTAIGAA